MDGELIYIYIKTNECQKLSIIHTSNRIEYIINASVRHQEFFVTHSGMKEKQE